MLFTTSILTYPFASLFRSRLTPMLYCIMFNSILFTIFLYVASLILSHTLLIVFFMLLLFKTPTLIFIAFPAFKILNSLCKLKVHLYLLLFLIAAIIYTLYLYFLGQCIMDFVPVLYKVLRSGANLVPVKIIAQWAANAVSSIPALHICTCKWWSILWCVKSEEGLRWEMMMILNEDKSQQD